MSDTPDGAIDNSFDDAFVDARDALESIQRHPLVDDPAAAEVRLLAAMLRHIRQYDVNPSRRIHHERDQLRQRRAELKREADDAEIWR